MPYGPRGNRYSIYDVMEKNGVFASNPANAGAMTEEGESLYKGPQEYPRMMYSPKGERRVTQAGERVIGLSGPEIVGRQTEIISRVVGSAEEEAKLRKEGWHDHPAKAMAAGGEEAPQVSAATKVSDLEAENKRLLEELAKVRAPKVAAVA